MLCIDTNHPDHPLAMDDFALVTDFFYRGPDFHGMKPICSDTRSDHASDRRAKVLLPPYHPEEFE